jgi:hypothetical protein
MATDTKEETTKSVELKPINGHHVDDDNDNDDEVAVVIPPDGGLFFVFFNFQVIFFKSNFSIIIF